MTNEQKYIELLKELAEVIAEKNNRLFFADLQIADLKKAVEELTSGENEK